MRLWHQALIPYLDRQHLLGQHRECAALRGAGWGRKHATVDYVFKYDPPYLVAYHYLVMDEMEKRGYHPDPIWRNSNYRGKTLGTELGWAGDALVQLILNDKSRNIFLEHNDEYLKECLNKLKSKGIEINLEER
jgi:uncharacterized protein (TIGR02328 family)